MERNKLVLLIIIVLVVLFAFVYLFKWQNDKSKSFSGYYLGLAEECKTKGSYNCCMASVEEMSKGNYQLEAEGCPTGFQRNMLKCESTFVWCEPVK